MEKLFGKFLLNVFNYNRYRIMDEKKSEITGKIYRHVLDKKNNTIKVELINYK